MFRIYLVVAFQPGNDIYYYNTQAAQLILQGASPYGHLFTGIPPELATPGAQNVFTYLPFTALYFLPFYLLGDVRFGVVAADMLIGLCLFQFGRRWSLVASAAFLLVPISTRYANNLVPALALVVLSVALGQRGRRLLSSLSLGLALASSVLVWLLVPFFVYRYLKRRELRTALVSFATFAAICVPFFVSAPREFLYDVLSYQFGRQPAPLFAFGGSFGIQTNASLSGLLFTMTGQPAPLILRGALTLLLLGACLFLRGPRPSGGRDGRFAELPMSSLLLRAATFTAGAVILLPSTLFLIYFELPVVLLLCWIAMLDSGAPSRYS